MRCPKCGYISFDFLDECLKCKKNIRGASESLGGTVYKKTAPAFLRFDQVAGDIGIEIDSAMAGAVDPEEYIDEDLEILMADDESEDGEEGEINFDQQEQDDLDITIESSSEDDDEGIEIDLSQFDMTKEDELDSDDDPEQANLSDEPSVLSVPEELNDLSDLEPPAKGSQADNEVLELEKGFDDLDFDLALGDLEEELKKDNPLRQEAPLSLDDIDFADTLELDSADDSFKKDIEDDDLDFDLDLGGLSFEKDDK
ncbi:hypothetical protein [Desulforhopalus singaporensis]|uniref:Uncharacterized protein n=1 Tax=Desulforhopalus singaporensis TaxID=91360 RepID=A0A1H0T001_9BACT|nr:hypothetical protein [Desulforhopalus singaporensis]SDP47412.1 hypothetical protein SAMN05660330_02886 [Desulforhopalus singaporensis]